MKHKIPEYVQIELAQKNHLDPKNQMRIATSMKAMFPSQNDYLNPFDEASIEQITYRNIPVSDIKTHTITNEEYDQLSFYQTNLRLRIPYLYISIFAFNILVFVVCMLANSGAFSSGEKGLFFIMILVDLLFIASSIKSANDTTVRRKSKIAKGTVIYFSAKYKPNQKPRTIHYGSVAFHEQQAYAKMIYCSESEYKNMTINSDVYVVVKGKKAFAVVPESPSL